MSIVIGLGGNVGTHEEIVERFRRAREALARLGRVRSAPLFRTAPIGPEQPAFLNTAVALEAPDLQPAELLAIVHEIEALLGRRRSHEARWGPRTIDLDVLVWEGRSIDQPGLRVPHPRLLQRRFALAPLAALVPAYERELAAVREQDVEEIATAW
ncbi:MAG: 2-amino-4-hydroxy-6-hydroxymethyldihydropteridine diphosphokinase [Myxococcales bacterium]|nr:2-amino-4-hydroxy-6-hydroxymethyldihydropteridine diphosphokinase [Myxococcales bacterium]